MYIQRKLIELEILYLLITRRFEQLKFNVELEI